MIAPSQPAEISVLPSALKARSKMRLPWPTTRKSRWPSSAVQMEILPLKSPVATSLPSREAAAVAAPVVRSRSLAFFAGLKLPDEDAPCAVDADERLAPEGNLLEGETRHGPGRRPPAGGAGRCRGRP